uniref:Uncharacterized protein n=1 Tax=Tanacetum cinerariifolium TaxID=118510 RepID=A0A6L2L5W5_TANCI|nr:hypothetical protein [Tanacetum cinerariifolium]
MLMSNVQPSFKDPDSPEDDLVIVVDDSDEDEEEEVHTTTNDEIKDNSVPKSLSPRSSQIQELTNQVLILMSQKHKLELKKSRAEAEAALLKAQPSFLNVGQLNELLKIRKYLHISLYSDIETEEGLCKELQLSVVDNSKLNVVYLLIQKIGTFVLLLEGLQGGKNIAYVKRNKAISLGKEVGSPVAFLALNGFKELTACNHLLYKISDQIEPTYHMPIVVAIDKLKGGFILLDNIIGLHVAVLSLYLMLSHSSTYCLRMYLNAQY